MRTDPPVSVPMDSGDWNAATLAAEPPLLPPILPVVSPPPAPTPVAAAPTLAPAGGLRLWLDGAMRSATELLRGMTASEAGVAGG